MEAIEEFWLNEYDLLEDAALLQPATETPPPGASATETITTPLAITSQLASASTPEQPASSPAVEPPAPEPTAVTAVPAPPATSDEQPAPVPPPTNLQNETEVLQAIEDLLRELGEGSEMEYDPSISGAIVYVPTPIPELQKTAAFAVQPHHQPTRPKTITPACKTPFAELATKSSRSNAPPIKKTPPPLLKTKGPVEKRKAVTVIVALPAKPTRGKKTSSPKETSKKETPKNKAVKQAKRTTPKVTPEQRRKATTTTTTATQPSTSTRNTTALTTPTTSKARVALY